MKNLKRYISKIFAITTISALAMTLSGCADDFLYDDTHVGDGREVEVSVGVTLPDVGRKEVLSRAQNGKLSLQIFDLMVYAFDGNGNLAQRYYFRDIDEGINQCDPASSTDSKATLSMRLSDSFISLFNMRVPSGNGYLMAVANVEIKSTALFEKLKNVSTRDELISLYARDSHYDADASILSGAYMETTETNMSEFDPSGKVVFRSGNLPGRIHVMSTTAAVQVNVNGKGPASAGGAFTLESYELVNLPGWTQMFPELGVMLDETEAKKHLVNSGELSVFEELGQNKYSCDFEVLEYKGTGSTSISKYGDRAAWQGFDNAGYKRFTNAPSTAPYIILRGSYSGRSNYVDENGAPQTGNVSADVEYYIFLGHDSGLGTAEGIRDFSTLRNWEYVYNITINGINDITVEVNRKEDHWRDDVEGDVVVMDSDNSHRFDSHYCQSEFDMTVKEIRELYKNKLLGFRVIVPAYSVDEEMFLKPGTNGKYINENSTGWGVYDSTTGALISGSTEYYKKKGYMDMNNLACVSADWVRFYMHKSTDATDKWMINYSDKLKDVNGSNNPYMLTIYRFLWQLVSIAESTSYKDTDTVRFTVFVQENYYGNNWNDRMVMSHGASGTTGSVHWSQFVNMSDRKIMLFPATKYSTDNQSSFSNPRRVLSQRSIRTIYKPTTGYKAWGTESVEEFFQSPTQQSWFKGTDWTEGRKMIRIAEDVSGKRTNLATNVGMSNTTSRYARVASFNSMKGKNWSDYLNYNSKYENSLHYRISGNVKLNSKYGVDDMIASCLGRNRDLNGDGKINPAEIRWYVPGISQLQALYVGNSGLPVEARLYQQEANDGKWVYKHYLSATRPAGDASNSILWAEEGLSTGQMNNSYAYGLRVRCVRDLGTDLTKEEDEWSGFYQHTKSISGYAAGYVDIDKLNDNCVRLALENKEQGGVVTTFSSANRPAKSFWYASKYINEGPTKTFSYTNSSTGKVTTYTVPDWTSSALTSIDAENRKSESTPQQRSLCAKNFGQGWRTPTISELAIMYWAGVFPREKNLLSRTRYTFWQQTDRGGVDILNNTGNDKSGRDPHSFTEKEFRLRYPWKNLQLPTTAATGHISQISGHYGSILCVKDKQ